MGRGCLTLPAVPVPWGHPGSGRGCGCLGGDREEGEEVDGWWWWVRGSVLSPGVVPGSHGQAVPSTELWHSECAQHGALALGMCSAWSSGPAWSSGTQAVPSTELRMSPAPAEGRALVLQQG